MNGMAAFQGPASSKARMDVMTIIQMCGQTSGLYMCLDAGDDASWAGASGQKWLDTSGNGYDFFLGADSGATGTDPTFTGTVGRRSINDYWLFDGGDYFTYDSANETWMRDLHKDGSAMTILSISYSASDVTRPLISTGANTLVGGICYMLHSSDVAAIFCFDTSISTNKGFGTADTVYPRIELNIISHTITSGTAVGAVMHRNSLEIYDSTFTTAGVFNENATQTMKIASWGNVADGQVANGDRMYATAIWSRMMSRGEQMALFYGLRGRFNK